MLLGMALSASADNNPEPLLSWDKPTTFIVGSGTFVPQRICHDLHYYQNQLRIDAKSGIKDVEKIENSFTDASNPKISVLDGSKTMTNEGKPAVTEFKEFLKTQAKVNQLKYDNKMMVACRAHVEDQIKASTFSHTGSDGSDPFKRISQVGTLKASGENIAVAFDKGGKDFALQFGIDDGVSSRGHRDNMFSAKWTHFCCDAGKYTSGNFKDYTFVVLNYATDFVGAAGVTVPSDAITEEKQYSPPSNTENTTTDTNKATTVQQDTDFASYVRGSVAAAGLLLAQSMF